MPTSKCCDSYIYYKHANDPEYYKLGKVYYEWWGECLKCHKQCTDTFITNNIRLWKNAILQSATCKKNT